MSYENNRAGTIWAIRNPTTITFKSSFNGAKKMFDGRVARHGHGWAETGSARVPAKRNLHWHFVRYLLDDLRRLQRSGHQRCKQRAYSRARHYFNGYSSGAILSAGNIVSKLENTFAVTASNAANVTSIKTTLKEAGQSEEVSARTEFEYNAYDNRKKVTEYDVADTARRVVRTTYKSTFQQQINYVWTQYNLVSLPDIETVYAGDGTTKAAETQFTVPRGNPTKILRWVNGSTYINSSYAYDEAGNPHSTFAAYDFATGKPVEVLDPGSTITKADYSDPLDRLAWISRGDAGSSLSGVAHALNKTKTKFEYDDTLQTLTTRTDLANFDEVNNAPGTAMLKVEKFDGFGRLLGTQGYDGDPLPVVSARDYDGLGRVVKVYNPCRPAASRHRTGRKP